MSNFAVKIQLAPKLHESVFCSNPQAQCVQEDQNGCQELSSFNFRRIFHLWTTSPYDFLSTTSYLLHLLTENIKQLDIWIDWILIFEGNSADFRHHRSSYVQALIFLVGRLKFAMNVGNFHGKESDERGQGVWWDPIHDCWIRADTHSMGTVCPL